MKTEQKVEPMPDSTAYPCAEPFSVTPNVTANELSVSSSCIIPSIKSQPMCDEQSATLYSNSTNFMYGSGDEIYPKTEPTTPGADDLNAFDASVSSPSIIPPDTISNLMSNGGVMASMPSQQTEKISGIMNLADSAYVKCKNMEFDKLLAPAQQSAQQSPPSQQAGQQFAATAPQLKQSSSYENIHGAFCYKNVTPTSEANVDVFQNYMGLDSNSSLRSAETGVSTNNSNIFSKTANNNKTSLALSEPPLMLEGPSMSLMSNIMRQGKNSHNGYTSVLPMSKSYESIKTFLDTPPQDEILNEFVSSSLVEGSVDTVQKLDDMAYKAAGDHIRASNTTSSTLNLLGSSTPSGVTCTSGSVLDNFLTEPPRTDLLSSVQQSLLVSRGEQNSFRQCDDMVRNMDLPATVPKQISLMDMKDVNAKAEKALETSISQKTAEGMFSSEISRMSENDLLCYINPNCFDEGQYLLIISGAILIITFFNRMLLAFLVRSAEI